MSVACTLITKGRELDCNRIAGGVKFVYFAIFDTTLVTQSFTGGTAGEATDIAMSGATKLYRYALPRGVSSVTDTLVGSTENGTVYYTPTITVIYNNLTAIDQNEVKLLAKTRLVVFAQLNQQLANGHDVILCLGAVNGMQVNAGTELSGAAWGDQNGYSLTFDGMEQSPMTLVTDYATDPFDNSDGGAAIPIDKD